MGAHHDYDRKRPALLEKVRLIDEVLQPDILAVLFDDMKGDTPDLARHQLTIAHDIAAHSKASRLIFCPSYYSTDPVLEKVFGAMPPAIWKSLASSSTAVSRSSGPAPRSARPSIRRYTSSR